jgi:hypothetical protein
MPAPPRWPSLGRPSRRLGLGLTIGVVAAAGAALLSASTSVGAESYAQANTTSTTTVSTTTTTGVPRTSCPFPSVRSVGIAVTPDGYWVAKSNGVVKSYGDAVHQLPVSYPYAPIVSISAVPGSTSAYFLLAANGAVIPVGGATGRGDASNLAGFGCNAVSISASPDGGGYMIAASNGNTLAYGDEYNYGGENLPAGSVSGFAANPADTGYWLLGTHGAVYHYGSVPTLCSLTSTKTMVAIASTPDGGGYWIVTRAGGIFSCGNATFFGSPLGHTTSPIVAMAGAPPGQPQGYDLLNKDGTVFPYGSLQTYPRS